MPTGPISPLVATGDQPLRMLIWLWRWPVHRRVARPRDGRLSALQLAPRGTLVYRHQAVARLQPHTTQPGSAWSALPRSCRPASTWCWRIMCCIMCPIWTACWRSSSAPRLPLACSSRPWRGSAVPLPRVSAVPRRAAAALSFPYRRRSGGRSGPAGSGVRQRGCPV